jgi:hypothetical protein
MKNCIQCGKEFQESPIKTGHEQKYCSSSCRMKAANKRREERLINTYKNEATAPTQQAIAELPVLQRQDNRPGTRGDISITDFLAALQETANARIEATTERLKREYAEQRIRELEEEIDEQDDDEPSGWLGKIDVNNLITQSAPYVLQPLSGAIGKILDHPEVINNIQQMIIGQKK